jgi:hypothetical protein
MTLSAKLRLGIVLALWAPLAAAQSTLGALLDVGAKKLSAQEFKEEVVQRVIVGPTASGASLEVMYATTGVIQGLGTAPTFPVASPISGEWTIDNDGRICTSMRVSGPFGGSATGVALPPRCQIWFKYKEQYFLSDSDSDRSAKVLRRTLKQ